MHLKLHILLLFALLLGLTDSLASDKFLKVTGQITDLSTNSELSGFNILLIEDDADSSIFYFDDSKYEIWLQDNHESKLYFSKEGYITQFVIIDATFIRSWAYEKKQRINNLNLKLNQGSGGMAEPTFEANYDPKNNVFIVEDHKTKINEEAAKNFNPPFPSPADIYTDVKPTNSGLTLTRSFDEKNAKGNGGVARIVQGILFADMSYCLFNERTNDANFFLEMLRYADEEAWGSLKDFDSPEYGRIIARTLNREQSMDTLFALGSFLETSRLIVQDFTSDSRVLVHLKMLKNVIENYACNEASEKTISFLNALKSLIPKIEKLESNYKDHLRERNDFMMQSDFAFLAIMEEIKVVHEEILSK